MEEDQPEAPMPLLPIDSFSYSWLVGFPSLEASIDDHPQNYEDYSSCSSFIEMDPRLPPSRRFFIKTSHESSFKFDNFIDEDHSLVHADELFRDGYVRRQSDEESEPLDETIVGKIETHGVNTKCPSFRKLRRWVLFKYLDFLTPLCRRLKRCRSTGSTRSIDMDTRIRVTTLSRRTRVYSDETTTSPRISVADDYNWRRSCDSESSIYEAVLHCKKSFEK